MFHTAISYTLSEYSVACHERFVTRSDEDFVELSPYAIASVQTSGNLISACGHFLSKMAFVIVYCFSAEEVGHAYGSARNSVSRMLSKHCKINVEMALEVRFCTCPVACTRSCRSTILGSWIVEMGPYCSYVSVALGCLNFATRVS